MVLKNFIDDVKCDVVTLIQSKLDDFTTIKVNFELFAYYILETKNLREMKSFQTGYEVCTKATNIQQLLDDFSDSIGQKMSEFLERESGKMI